MTTQIPDVLILDGEKHDMASLPLEANVQTITVMASKMPLVGRG